MLWGLFRCCQFFLVNYPSRPNSSINGNCGLMTDHCGAVSCRRCFPACRFDIKGIIV